MRVPKFAIVAVLTLAGCSSGTRTIIVVRPTSPPAAPAPAPTVVTRAPAPAALPALEVALGRPSAGRLVVQTNRPAYVAIFEITPQQGVAFAHPTTLRQASMVLSGIVTIPVTWESGAADRRVSATGRQMRVTRYFYALASDKPLRITEASFQPGYLEQALGPAAYRAAAPQPAVNAIVRHFAYGASSGTWASDLYTVQPSDVPVTYRVARIYCPGGTVYEVPENIADRSWCPAPSTGSSSGGRGRGNGPVADNASVLPDSTVGPDGRRVPRRGMGNGRANEAPGHSGTRPGNGGSGQSEPRATPDPRRPDHAATPERGQAEKERVEKERLEAERAATARADRERAEKDRLARESEERGRADAEKARRDQAHADSLARDRSEKDKAARDKAQRDENARMTQERAEREKAERDAADTAARLKADQERAEREKAAKDSADKERADKERAEKERAEKERAATETAERESAAKERADAQNAANARAAQEQADKERAEKETAEKEKPAKDKADKENADAAQAAKDKADTEKAASERAEKEKAEKEKAEKEKAEKEKAEKEKADKEKAEKEKGGKDKPAVPPESDTDKSKPKAAARSGPPGNSR